MIYWLGSELADNRKYKNIVRLKAIEVLLSPSMHFFRLAVYALGVVLILNYIAMIVSVYE